MTNKQKGIIGIISAAVLLIIGSVLLFIAPKFNPRNAFDYVKKLGATASSTFPGSLEYNGYRFFSNNRVVRLNDGQKGSYTHEAIKLDNGTTILISDIFKQ